MGKGHSKRYELSDTTVPYTAVDNNTLFKLTLIAKKAKEQKTLKFTSLIHLLNYGYFLECFKQLKSNKAAGIDQRTMESYEPKEIQKAAFQTAVSLKAKTYRPQPVRRVFIPKGNGKLRPLGIPTCIDKVVQLACAKILEPIFEPIFLDLSYGFRPLRSAHQALAALNHMVMGQKVNWIIDADIEGFFDNVDHDKMIRCLKERINDPNFLHLIRRFLKAGVMNEGRVEKSGKGTPQGGVISPILANIYLHYVLDLWFTVREQKQLTGYSQLIRYADDFVIGFQHKVDAKKVLADIRGRFAEFGLKLAEDKTRILEFGRFAAKKHAKRNGGKPTTFDFLGFTHYCSTTRDGRYALKLKTSRKKYGANLSALTLWTKSVRNRMKLEDIWKMLALKLKGHYNYYGLSGNFDSIKGFYRHTRRTAFKWLNRRSQKTSWTWEQFDAFLEQHPLPIPKLTYAIYNTW